MTIRSTASAWLKLNFPKEINSATRTSKFYPERELWFFTFPATYFEKNENETLNILCEHETKKMISTLSRFHSQYLMKIKAILTSGEMAKNLTYTFLQETQKSS